MKYNIDQLETGILSGNRASLSRAITLVESKRQDHRDLASELIQRLLPHTGNAIRIGISGVPGAGKSTTIEHFGSLLTQKLFSIAVLAVDPSSTANGGSILGDKTRMGALAVDKNAYIRPSPSAGTLGGVAAKTRETILLCEAAGFDIILVETVGTGQSEVTVSDMVDIFIVLMIPNAGDDLQGIKKGILEIADIIAVNKADGERTSAARRAVSDYQSALNLVGTNNEGEKTSIFAISALEGTGLEQLWQTINNRIEKAKTSGSFNLRRSQQQVNWMNALILEQLINLLNENNIKSLKQELEIKVKKGELLPTLGAKQLLTKLQNEGMKAQ